MIMEVKTWQKESYSLYDYENRTHVKETSFQVDFDSPKRRSLMTVTYSAKSTRSHGVKAIF